MGLLSACGLPMSENVQVEELLRAPRLPGDYGALQNALNEWLGESAQLKYPMQGELLSPFLLQDLDGDGQQDAAVLYTTAQSSNVCIAFLQKDAAGVWQVRQSIEGLADTVDNVRLAQLQDGAATQLVVGYLAAQGDSYLAVYSYENGTVNAILEQSYEQYLVEDITGGGNEDLILMSTLEDGGVQIELLTVDRDGMFQQVAVMGLSADKFSGCAAVAAGLGADGKRYLVLDGWTGLSGNNLATVLLYFDEESQQMLPAEQISTSELYNASLRNVSTLVSRDLDGDGIMTKGNRTLSNHGDLEIIGNQSPRYQYSINMSLNWNGIGLSMLWQGVGKRDWYPWTESGFFWGKWNRAYNSLMKTQTGDNVVRIDKSTDNWRVTNMDKNPYWTRMVSLAANRNDGPLTWENDHYLQDASYIRLKNVEIGYTLPSAWASKLRCSSLRIYATGVNLFTVSKFISDYWDPETGADAYPMQRQVFVGVNLTF